MLRLHQAQIDAYAHAFADRIIPPFETLQADAERVAENYANPFLTDASDLAEQAFAAGADYYVAMAAVRQSVINLMVAGLFHLLEQHASYAMETALPAGISPPSGIYALPRLDHVLKGQGIAMKGLQSWPQVAELELIANAVKHGSGPAASKLRAQKPELFKRPVVEELFPGLRKDLPILPLAGDGIYLTPIHFALYAAVTKQFWEDVITALLPIMRPDLVP